MYLDRCPYHICVGHINVDHKDVKVFTKSVLSWWASHSSKFPAWAEAARILFSFTPNSAAAERVFSLLKIFFTDVRDSALHLRTLSKPHSCCATISARLDTPCDLCTM